MTTTIFDDALAADWQDWSWDSRVELDSTRQARDGDTSIRVRYRKGWAGLYLSLPEGQVLDANASDTLKFSIHGGFSEKEIGLFVVNENNEWLDAGVLRPDRIRWSEVSVPMSTLGNPSGIRGIVFQELQGDRQTPYYIDNLVLQSNEADSPDQPNPPGTTQLTVYDDSLAEPWQNWSWQTTVNTNREGGRRKSGTSSISARHRDPWAGLYLAAPEGVSTRDFDTLHFSVNGGTNGGQFIDFSLRDQYGTPLPAQRFTASTNVWTDYTIDLESLGSPGAVTGLVWQEFSGNGNQNTFFVDEIYFSGKGEGDDSDPVGAGPTITVNPNSVVREINDDIYGLNFADSSLANELGLTVDRWGGNSTSRYNYQIDASNRANDFFFENHPEDRVNSSGPLPESSSLNDFIRKDRAVGADSVVTVNTIGWITKSREIVGGFEIDKYGPQQVQNPWRNNGNGIRPDGTPITGNDPRDTSIPVDEQYAAELVSYLVSEYGRAADGGVQFYALDNEPMLWNSTHRDVHPQPASYEEVLETGIAAAQAIKNADPTADVLGPVVWGWVAYFYSALDVAGGAFWDYAQDRVNYDDVPFLPWYLQGMAEAEQETGQRLLDYLDIHFYPQQANVALTKSGGTAATQALRLESTRSLWDEAYVDDSWINEEVYLIPRMREWIDEYYPGTKLAITEYNFGGTDHISGALAQADALGIFGREGVDLAAFWANPDPSDAVSYAFRMFRNYDGEADEGSRFGSTGVLASSSDESEVSVFAAQRDSDDALTVMLINKSADDLVTPITLPGEFDGSNVEVYTYDESNPDRIVASDMLINFTNEGSFDAALPGYSITLLEIPSSSAFSSAIAGQSDESAELGSAVAAEVRLPWELLAVSRHDQNGGSGQLDEPEEPITFAEFLVLAHQYQNGGEF